MKKTDTTNPFCDAGSSPPNVEDEIWTSQEVARFLKIEPAAVYTLTRRRSQRRHQRPIPFLKLHNKALRFRKSDVVRWVERLAQASLGRCQ